MKILLDSTDSGSVKLYEVRNDNGSSRKVITGYLLVITGKTEKSWQYGASEEFWACRGFDTLKDADNRGVLNDRSKWKPYQGKFHYKSVAKLLPA
jgi:hypothetical protein